MRRAPFGDFGGKVGEATCRRYSNGSRNIGIRPDVNGGPLDPQAQPNNNNNPAPQRISLSVQNNPQNNLQNNNIQNNLQNNQKGPRNEPMSCPKHPNRTPSPNQIHQGNGLPKPNPGNCQSVKNNLQMQSPATIPTNQAANGQPDAEFNKARNGSPQCFADGKAPNQQRSLSASRSPSHNRSNDKQLVQHRSLSASRTPCQHRSASETRGSFQPPADGQAARNSLSLGAQQGQTQGSGINRAQNLGDCNGFPKGTIQTQRLQISTNEIIIIQPGKPTIIEVHAPHPSNGQAQNNVPMSSNMPELPSPEGDHRNNSNMSCLNKNLSLTADGAVPDNSVQQNQQQSENQQPQSIINPCCLPQQNNSNMEHQNQSQPTVNDQSQTSVRPQQNSFKENQQQKPPSCQQLNQQNLQQEWQQSTQQPPNQSPLALDHCTSNMNVLSKDAVKHTGSQLLNKYSNSQGEQNKNHSKKFPPLLGSCCTQQRNSISQQQQNQLPTHEQQNSSPENRQQNPCSMQQQQLNSPSFQQLNQQNLQQEWQHSTQQPPQTLNRCLSNMNTLAKDTVRRGSQLLNKHTDNQLEQKRSPSQKPLYMLNVVNPCCLPQQRSSTSQQNQNQLPTNEQQNASPENPCCPSTQRNSISQQNQNQLPTHEQQNASPENPCCPSTQRNSISQQNQNQHLTNEQQNSSPENLCCPPQQRSSISQQNQNQLPTNEQQNTSPENPCCPSPQRNSILQQNQNQHLTNEQQNSSPENLCCPPQQRNSISQQNQNQPPTHEQQNSSPENQQQNPCLTQQQQKQGSADQLASSMQQQQQQELSPCCYPQHRSSVQQNQNQPPVQLPFQQQQNSQPGQEQFPQQPVTPCAWQPTNSTLSAQPPVSKCLPPDYNQTNQVQCQGSPESFVTPQFLAQGQIPAYPVEDPANHPFQRNMQSQYQNHPSDCKCASQQELQNEQANGNQQSGDCNITPIPEEPDQNQAAETLYCSENCNCSCQSSEEIKYDVGLSQPPMIEVNDSCCKDSGQIEQATHQQNNNYGNGIAQIC